MKHEHEHEVNIKLPPEVGDALDGLQQAKEHIQENRPMYLVGAGCLVFGFVLGKHFQRPLHITNVVHPPAIVLGDA